MNNESKEIPVRNQWIDIVKSVAIISVVVGHALNTNNYFDAGIDEIRKFIYTYHLVVLFWITGYCWKRKNLSEFITKLKKTYTRYVPYAIGSFLLLPLWVRMGVVDPCRLSIKGIIYDISKILMFQVTRGIFMGALRFVTWKTVTEILLYIIGKIVQKTNWKYCWMCMWGGSNYWISTNIRI